MVKCRIWEGHGNDGLKRPIPGFMIFLAKIPGKSGEENPLFLKNLKQNEEVMYAHKEEFAEGKTGAFCGACDKPGRSGSMASGHALPVWIPGRGPVYLLLFIDTSTRRSCLFTFGEAGKQAQ